MSPSSQVIDLISACPQETGKCEAVFDFEGDVSAGELSFTTGEVIETTEWVNEEWMSGRIGSRQGIFPVNFVKVIKELPKQSMLNLHTFARTLRFVLCSFSYSCSTFNISSYTKSSSKSTNIKTAEHSVVRWPSPEGCGTFRLHCWERRRDQLQGRNITCM